MEQAASGLHSDSMRDLQAHIQRDIEAMQEQLRSEHHPDPLSPLPKPSF
jgi:hypothetical protein